MHRPAVAGLVALLAVASGCHAKGGGGPYSPTFACNAQGAANVTIDLTTMSVSTLRNGYLHGIRDPNGPDPTAAESAAYYQSAKALGAKSWRVSDPWHTQFLAPLHIDLTYVLFDGFAHYDPTVQPWVPDFTKWDAYVTKVAQTNLAAGSPITYFDIWGEPSAGQANLSHMLDTFHHAYQDIRAVDSKVKIIGPCPVSFQKAGLAAFLDDIIARGDKYAGLCWHSFGKPEDVITEADEARKLIAARPSLGSMELHVNEYMPYEQHEVPGYDVAWLADLEIAHIDVANRACWDLYDGQGRYPDCWHGIEGVYMRDGVTPQPVYWVLSAYGALGADRFAVTSDTAGITALAGRDASTGKLVVLVGNEGAPAKAGFTVHLTITGAPAGSADYSTDLVPSVGPDLHAQALTAPEVGPSGTLTPAAGSASLDLGCVPSGGAVVVRAGL